MRIYHTAQCCPDQRVCDADSVPRSPDTDAVSGDYDLLYKGRTEQDIVAECREDIRHLETLPGSPNIAYRIARCRRVLDFLGAEV